MCSELRSNVEELLHRRLDANLLAEFAEDALARVLAELEEPARKGPAVLGQASIPLDEQDPSSLKADPLDDDARHRRVNGGAHERSDAVDRLNVVLSRPIPRMGAQGWNAEPDGPVGSERGDPFDLERNFVWGRQVKKAVPMDQEDPSVALHIVSRVHGGRIVRWRPGRCRV